jgi:hypothetical protein
MSNLQDKYIDKCVIELIINNKKIKNMTIFLIIFISIIVF